MQDWASCSWAPAQETKMKCRQTLDRGMTCGDLTLAVLVSKMRGARECFSFSSGLSLAKVFLHVGMLQASKHQKLVLTSILHGSRMEEAARASHNQVDCRPQVR